MPESFKADPAHIAGYAVLTDTIGMNTARLGGFVRTNAARGHFQGLLGFLRPAAESYANATGDRLGNSAERLVLTANELNRSAWVYSGADESAYTQVHDINPDIVTGYRDFESPQPYPEPAAFELPQAPDIASADFRAQIDEVGGALGKIDGMIAEVTGESPVNEIITPLAGNPNELRAAAEALTSTGSAAELIARNLTGSLAQLDPYWNGGAAADFTSYLTRLAAVIEEELPLNEVVAVVYEQVAIQLEAAAQWMIDTLKKSVDQAIEGLALGWIPFYGWARAIETVGFIINTVEQAQQIVDDVERVINDAQRVIEIASDPVGAAQAELEERLAPFREKIDQAGRTAEFAGYLADLADTREWQEAPGGDYEVGTDPRRAGA